MHQWIQIYQIADDQSPNVNRQHQTVRQKWKWTGNLNTGCENIQSETMDGIRHRKMRPAKDKW